MGIGVIGLRMGLAHIRAAGQIPGARVVSVCDVNEETLQRVAREHAVPHACTDYRELVENPDVELVVVASPDHFHREHTERALAAGKHVLCEKPMAWTLEECRSMIAAQKRSGRLLYVGHLVRLTPAFSTARKMVEEGILGQVYYVGATYQHDYAKLGGHDNWRFDPKLARHIFLGGGCHAVDLMRHFVGQVSSVTAVSNHIGLPKLPTDDLVVALYQGDSGAVGRVFVSGGCKRPYEIALELYGTKGTLVANNVDQEFRVWLDDVPDLGKRWITVPTSVDNHPTMLQLRHVMACIRDGATPLVPGEEGARTVAASLAAIDAAERMKRESGFSIPAL